MDFKTCLAEHGSIVEVFAGLYDFLDDYSSNEYKLFPHLLIELVDPFTAERQWIRYYGPYQTGSAPRGQRTTTVLPCRGL